MIDSPLSRYEHSLDRRDFLRLAGASVALAGLDGCTRMPAEHILPYVDNRPELTPGVPSYYATAMVLDGCATGLLVESHDGRPTKVEGNPDHPASLGAAGAIEQASVLQLYDPDRAKSARIGPTHVSWKALAATLAPDALRRRVGARGARLALLIEPTSSLLDEALLARVLNAYPDARVYMYAPLVADRNAQPVVPRHDASLADVIFAIDSDFLATGPFHLRHARQFADNRRLARPTDSMNRLYVAESSFTATGATADHRFAVRPRNIMSILTSLLAAVRAGGVPEAVPGVVPAPAWLAPVARDLTANPGRCVVILGDAQPPAARALADQINALIGATGRTTWYSPTPLIGSKIAIRPIDELVAAMRARALDTLVIVGGNPSYATPAAMDFSTLLRSVPNAGYVGLYENETARDVRWFAPQSHYLERWGDARAYDGTVSIVQPLVDPLYESIAPPELYAAIAGMSPASSSSYDLVRQSWAERGGTEDGWADALRRGVVVGSAFSESSEHSGAHPVPETRPHEAAGTVDVVYGGDPKVHDGSFSNNGWLQELPATLTQLVWGNAALLSPATAKRLGVSNGDAVTIGTGPRATTIAALVVPGHADDTVALHFGYGRSGHESVARDVGANVFSLWPAIGTRAEFGVPISVGGKAKTLTLAQTHSVLEASQPVRRASLQQYREFPAGVGQRSSRVLSLYPDAPPRRDGNAAQQWAMTIDLTTCIGCGACVVGCQAENNVPVVGADQVGKGREMHWMRIDRYFADGNTATEALLQPMLCQQCEEAPCEQVCPVEATVHSDDGLNEMVYNRCVGTRFCSNNCPYKVRRFNWFDYNEDLSESELMVKNPDVTVRERGVMEKCTFCVQRIREAEISAGRDGRELKGSDVQTACQQACPSKAIVFGSITDADSDVVRHRSQPRSYAALNELGTEPRVRYLARIRNINPEVPDE